MKKRYAFTLTRENVETLQALIQEVGLPPGTLSNVVDDSIKEVSKVFAMAKAKGTFTIKDVFSLVGEQMELIQGEAHEQAVGETDKRSKKRGKPKNSA